MMGNNIDDELLKKFFEDNKIDDIPDNGFSDRVMRHLPRHNEWINTLWTVVCAIAVVVYFVINKGLSVLKLALLNIYGDISGAAVSIHLGVGSLVMIYVGIIVVTVVVAYNMMSHERNLI